MNSERRSRCRHGTRRVQNCRFCEAEFSWTEGGGMDGSIPPAASAYINRMREGFGNEPAWQESILADAGSQSQREDPYTGRQNQEQDYRLASNPYVQRRPSSRFQRGYGTNTENNSPGSDVEAQNDHLWQNGDQSQAGNDRLSLGDTYRSIASGDSSRRNDILHFQSDTPGASAVESSHLRRHDPVLFRWGTESTETLDLPPQRRDESWSRLQPPSPWNPHHLREVNENTIEQENVDTEFLADVEESVLDDSE